VYSTTATQAVPADRATVYAGLDGAITMTTSLRDDGNGGTEVEIRMDGLPDAVPADQNELGTRMALDKLARLVG